VKLAAAYYTTRWSGEKFTFLLSLRIIFVFITGEGLIFVMTFKRCYDEIPLNKLSLWDMYLYYPPSALSAFMVTFQDETS